MKRLKNLATGFSSLFTGMRVTITEFFKPSITMQYPHESIKMTTRFRGHIELVRDEATGKAICYACKVCEKACPSDCITVDGMKFEGDKRKSVTTFTLDFTKCSLCGSCVEACKSSAIRFSREYNLASTTREEYVMDLFKRLEAESKTAEGAASTTPAAAAANQPVATAQNQTAAVVASQPPVAVENKGESH